MKKVIRLNREDKPVKNTAKRFSTRIAAKSLLSQSPVVQTNCNENAAKDNRLLGNTNVRDGNGNLQELIWPYVVSYHLFFAIR